MELTAQILSHNQKVEVINANLQKVKERIEKAEGGGEIRVVAITKYVDASWCRALIDCGLTELGENRILEGIEKYKILRDEGLEFTAHMVGTIQSNKAGRIPGRFDFVQSVDREKIADILARKSTELGINLPVLIEVNIDEEEQKSGAMPADVYSLAEHIVSLRSLSLRGLMCIPSAPAERGITKDYELKTRSAFARTRRLFEELKACFGSQIDTLSMGMSLDFEWALEEGANMIRVGRILYLPAGVQLAEQ